MRLIVFLVLLISQVLKANDTEMILECTRRFTVAFSVPNEAEVFGFLKYAGRIDSSMQEFKARLKPYFRVGGEEYVYFDERYQKLVVKDSKGKASSANCNSCATGEVQSCSIVNSNCTFDLGGGMTLTVPTLPVSSDDLRSELTNFFSSPVGAKRLRKFSERIFSTDDKTLHREYTKLLEFCKGAFAESNKAVSEDFYSQISIKNRTPATTNK